MVAGDERTALCFSLSPGQDGDAPRGRELLGSWENRPESLKNIVMDKAYEGDETRQLILDLELTPVVPPKANRHNNKGCSQGEERALGLHPWLNKPGRAAEKR